MTVRAFVLAISAIATVAGHAQADGLIYNLPADGSWARFQMQMCIRDLTSLDGKPMPTSEIVLKGTVTLRSVGSQDTSAGPGRWIELESSGPPTEEFPGRIIVLKMLIPVKYLAAGSDPLAHVEEIYYWSRDWEFDHDPQAGVKEQLHAKPRIRYEIERFRTLFPFPSNQDAACRTLRDQAVQTPLGSLTATKVAYPMQFAGKLSGGTSGRWTCSGMYTLWLSSDSPFGVVAVETGYSQVEEYETKSSKTNKYELNGDGSRSKNNVQLKLEASGADAKSAMPEFPNRGSKSAVH